MANQQDLIIEARDLAAGYGDKLIWKQATFTVKRGEFVGVLGPNGAGKTTLLRLLLGLVAPAHGSLKVNGKLPRRGNPRIGYVPQRHSIDGELRLEALEFVRLGVNGTRWGMPWPGTAADEKQKALDSLKAVDAIQLAHRALGELSGGELQRIFMAQALAGGPELLLLDEPLANLDIRRETELIRLVAKVVREQKMTVLLIAHNINPLLPAVDRLIYAVNGRIAAGRPKEIITTKKLSELYGAPVEVLSDSRGRIAVLGTEEAAHHE